MKLIIWLLILSCLIGFIAPVYAQDETTFVGSAKSNKYHYTWCQWAKKIKPYNLVTFNSAQDAIKSGYVPCKVCKPPIK